MFSPNRQVSDLDLLCTFSYEKGALVAEDCADTTYQAEKQKHSKRSSGEYIPSAKVASRLPHMLVRPLSASSEVRPFDT